MTKREHRRSARNARLGEVRRQQKRNALLRMQVISVTSCRRPMNAENHTPTKS